MVRVPLPFRGVAVLLLAASTVIGQTPEPPAELPLDPGSSSSAEFLRQFSSENNHPLLSLMVDGQLTSFDSASAPESSRIKPTPKTPPKTPAAEADEACPVEDECPEVATFLPYACPPPPPHKHRLFHRHHDNEDGAYGSECGNPYLGWPCDMGNCYNPSPYSYQAKCCAGHKWFHKHGCAANNAPAYTGCHFPCGSGYGGGFIDGDCWGGCAPYLAPPPPPPCHCRKCQRKHAHGQQGGYPGYGSPYGDYGSMGNDGFMDGGFCDGCSAFAPPLPPQCHCRKCQRKRGYGYEGCGYPSWPAYPVPGANVVDDCYNGYSNANGCGCGKHHYLFGRCHHHKQQPYPYCAYPQMMPCMDVESFCADCIGE